MGISIKKVLFGQGLAVTSIKLEAYKYWKNRYLKLIEQAHNS